MTFKSQGSISGQPLKRPGSKLLLLGSFCFAVSSLWMPIKINARLLAHEVMSEIRQNSQVSVDETSTATRTINFRLQANNLVNVLTDCFDDADCRIYYLHFGKSGGTDLEERMFKVFPPYMDSYCGGSMMKCFHERSTKYCNAKFSSYQAESPFFLKTIVPSCMTQTGSKAVVLVSFREPIQRGLSYIHQMCNKSFRRRNKSTRQACSRCSYEQDTDFWDGTVTHFNNEYKELQEVITANIDNTSVLSVDSVDLTPLYERLFAATNHTAFKRFRKANREETKRCDFGVTSEMLRRLAPSSEIYRNLTMGIHA